MRGLSGRINRAARDGTGSSIKAHEAREVALALRLIDIIRRMAPKGELVGVNLYPDGDLSVLKPERVAYVPPGGPAPVAYLRDVDGTGSLHPCAEGDPGAFPVWRERQ